LWLLMMVTNHGRSDDTFKLRSSYTEAMIAYVGGDDTKAFILLSPLAEQDVAIAQLFLARLLIHSPLIAQDCDLGVRWLARSLRNGSGEAAYDMGQLFRRGHCVEQSDLMALDAFLSADAMGYPDAPGAVGTLYLGTEEIAPNHQAAIQWLKKGAAMFDADACFQLGILYAGYGEIPRDDGEAYKWFDISASFAFSSSDRYERAIAYRDRIREKLSPMEVEQANADASRELISLLRRNRQRGVAGAPRLE
jgi:TPR repeat protein